MPCLETRPQVGLMPVRPQVADALPNDTGAAGQGFLRFSCAEPDERLHQAVSFFADAVTRTERVKKYVETHPRYRLAQIA